MKSSESIICYTNTMKYLKFIYFTRHRVIMTIFGDLQLKQILVKTKSHLLHIGIDF